jgi:hypothetical protein
MRGKGITYDTGFIRAGTSTREAFDPGVVDRELRVIHEYLHCNAVRVTGGDPDRLELAATHAAEAGLEVWLSPFTCDLTTDELLDLLADCVERAERLRRRGAEVVLLTGSELSLFSVGSWPATPSSCGSACWPRRGACASCCRRSPPASTASSPRPSRWCVSGSPAWSATLRCRSRASTGRPST